MSILLVVLFGLITNSYTIEGLNNGTITIISQDTTLFCITENMDTPQVTWSRVDQDGIISVPPSALNDTTGVSHLELTNDNPGTYSCQVTRNGINTTYVAEILGFGGE